MEVWKDIKDWEGYYQISNYGRVRSLDRVIYYKDKRTFKYKGIILAPKKRGKGYLGISFFKRTDNIIKQHYIHILVAQYFVSNPYNLPEVNHIDGDKQNNNDWNLEWTDRFNNLKHAKKLNLLNNKNDPFKLSDEDVFQIRSRYNKGESKTSLSEFYKVAYSTIHNIVNNITWKNAIQLRKRVDQKE